MTGIERPLVIVLVEDNPLDGELAVAQLEAAGFVCETVRVETRDAFANALLAHRVDVILSDFSLPAFDGWSALSMARDGRPDVPFIFVSGAIGEEMAIETLRRGATDYVLKHRLERLAPAVSRALREVDERTERRRAESERDALLVLEREARREAETASRTKDEFLAIVSHELRTPLNAILGWTRMMRSGQLRPEQYERALETIDRNARNQVGLIEDLLDISRIVTGKLRLDVSPVDLAQVIEASLDTVRPAADAKGVRVELDVAVDDASASGDANRLQQVIWNLVSNAVKFTPRGGHVTVGLAREDDLFVLRVTDSGEGIAPDFLPYVFHRFRQADASSTRSHGGLGLGLSIVKSIVELHGGTITVTSDGLGHGSTFALRLPAARDARPMHRGSLAPGVQFGRALAGLRVLLVEDQDDARELFASVLELAGAEVLQAGSARDALVALEARVFDVLLSDVGMPGEDGYTLVRRVRALARRDDAGRIVAVALTAFAREDDRAAAFEAGFDAHVAKPVEPSELVAAVARATGRS